MNWNASKFWVDGGCLGNQAYGKRKAYGSISDGAAVMRVQFADARTSNEAEYMVLSSLLDNLLRNCIDPTKTEDEHLYGFQTGRRSVDRGLEG